MNTFNLQSQIKGEKQSHTTWCLNPFMQRTSVEVDQSQSYNWPRNEEPCFQLVLIS